MIPEIVVETARGPVEPSMDDLRGMYESAVIEEPEVKDDEPVKETPVKVEPESGTGEKEQDSEVEPELPEGVKKRIAKEVERANAADLAIRQAISERKAKEDELAKLTGKTGSEPAPTTEPAKNVRPVRPRIETFQGTLDEFTAADAKYEADLENWLVGETKRTVEKEFNQRNAESTRAAWLQKSTETHGADFPAMVKALETGMPEQLQVAVSAMGDPAAMVAHLGKDSAALQALVSKFEANPYAGIAELGKIEATLNSKQTEKPVITEKPLPAPLKPIGGNAAAVAPGVDLTKPEKINELSDSSLLKEIGRMAESARK